MCCFVFKCSILVCFFILSPLVEWTVGLIDAVERFQLTVFCIVVFLQNYWASGNLDPVVFFVILVEFFVDWMKHGFLVKFNSIPVTEYGRYSETVAQDLSVDVCVSLLFTDPYVFCSLWCRNGLPSVEIKGCWMVASLISLCKLSSFSFCRCVGLIDEILCCRKKIWICPHSSVVSRAS